MNGKMVLYLLIVVVLLYLYGPIFHVMMYIVIINKLLLIIITFVKFVFVFRFHTYYMSPHVHA